MPPQELAWPRGLVCLRGEGGPGRGRCRWRRGPPSARSPVAAEGGGSWVEAGGEGGGGARPAAVIERHEQQEEEQEGKEGVRVSSPPGSARLRAGSSSPAPLSSAPDRDALEERGDVFLHLLSPPKGKSIARCMICWRRSRTRTVTSARQKCFCLVLLGSVLTCSGFYPAGQHVDCRWNLHF